MNLFNFSGNLYNKNLSIEFIEFIRGEKNLTEYLIKKQIKMIVKKQGNIIE